MTVEKQEEIISVPDRGRKYRKKQRVGDIINDEEEKELLKQIEGVE